MNSDYKSGRQKRTYYGGGIIRTELTGEAADHTGETGSHSGTNRLWYHRDPERLHNIPEDT